MTKQQLLTDVALQRGDMPGDGGGGQLLMSLLIDNFGLLHNPVIPLGGRRYAAIVLLAIALGLIYRSNVVKEAGKGQEV